MVPGLYRWRSRGVNPAVYLHIGVADYFLVSVGVVVGDVDHFHVGAVAL